MEVVEAAPERSCFMSSGNYRTMSFQFLGYRIESLGPKTFSVVTDSADT